MTDLVMLGTGNAEALDCYNSCCLIDNGGRFFLVDAGGGNGVLRQLRDAGVRWQDVRDIFITHRHVDHSLGVIWLIRHILAAAKAGSYDGAATIYGHHEVIDIIRRSVPLLFGDKHEKRARERIRLQEVHDGETLEIAGCRVTFFDVHARKTLQYGFSLELPDGGRLVSCGDEPANEAVRPYTENAAFLMHEAFCLAEETNLVARKGRNHSTVEEAAANAESLGAGSLILHHTQDNSLARRKETYTDAAGRHFSGRIFVPDDLERIVLSAGG